MVSENQVRMAVISGASKALRLKADSPNSTDSEILQAISYDMDDILQNIDKNI